MIFHIRGTYGVNDRVRNPRKIHAIDLGLRRVVSFGQPSRT